ncbi:conjugative transposon protein TraM [Pedobacter sp. UBA4863]|uniref:conjugative transposon protein TraM n=1 Tax=Pedobacter sp. UBA4863 TaxID=1947060 RepID=UPI0025FA8819|nr:conjugative transposon protein TraM [Pedobacter sp. UBA4863]
MKEEKSIRGERQKKFLLVLPLITLPFLTMIFWALGGGQKGMASETATGKGINLELPNASFQKEKSLDKMAYYDDANADSAKIRDQMKTDPYYQQPMGEAQFQTGIGGLGYVNANSMGYANPNEEKVYQKLRELDMAMNSNAQQSGGYNKATPATNKGEIERLEKMIAAMGKTEADPEMQQINGMLESILDLQHPERVQEKLRQHSESKKGQVFAIKKGRPKDPLTTLESKVGTEKSGNSFFSLDENNETEEQNSVTAVIHGDQTVVSGATVKLRLTDDVYINGVLIPSGQFVFGVANLAGERLGIKVDGIRFGNSLFPVSLSVYDIDGLDGIYIPGAISRDVAKSSADRSIQNIGMATLDPSFGAQAAGAGIEAAKSLFSKKVKLVRVNIKAGYQVLLKDEKQKLQN